MAQKSACFLEQRKVYFSLSTLSLSLIRRHFGADSGLAFSESLDCLSVAALRVPFEPVTPFSVYYPILPER